MDSILVEKKQQIAFVTLNRVEKYNAFDDSVIANLQAVFDGLQRCQQTRAIILKANGKHFCAGADLAWMKRMKDYSQADNYKDSLALAKLLNTIYEHPKPVVASVQGYAFGGGVGLIAACDFAICSEASKYSFSEAKLGLIPAVISPYVIKSIGQRNTKKLFLTAEIFSAKTALSLGLAQKVCKDEELSQKTLETVQAMIQNGPKALMACKRLVNDIASLTIDESILSLTAERIALHRVSQEGQEGLAAFFEQRQPQWS